MPMIPNPSLYFAPWPYTGAPRDPEQAIAYVNERLLELSARLAIWGQYLSFGPVPGAYHALHFLIRDWDDASTAVAVGDVSPAIVVPVEMTPLALTVSTIGGSATVQLLDGATEQLVADLDSAATPPYVNTAPAFVHPHRIGKDAELTLRVESITGTPLAVLGVLWVNQLPQDHNAMTFAFEPTTDWKSCEEAIAAIARKASVGVTPQAHEDYLWVRLGMKELRALAVLEEGRRVGTMFYDVQGGPDGFNSILHIAGWHMDGSARRGWVKRGLAPLLELSERLGCGKRVNFSSPRSGWARAVGATVGFKNVSLTWMLDGEEVASG